MRDAWTAGAWIGVIASAVPAATPPFTKVRRLTCGIDLVMSSLPCAVRCGRGASLPTGAVSRSVARMKRRVAARNPGAAFPHFAPAFGGTHAGYGRLDEAGILFE